MNKIAEVLWNLIETIVRAVFGVILKIAHKELNEEQWETLFQFVKFGLVGVWNTIFNYVIYLVSLIALQGAGIDKMTVLGFDNAPVAVWIATAIGFLISVFVSFLLNSRFVFKLEEGKSRSFGKALLKTYLSYGVTGIVLNPVLNTVWVSVCHISDRIAPLISLVIAISINFLMNKLWSFKAEK